MWEWLKLIGWGLILTIASVAVILGQLALGRKDEVEYDDFNF